MIEPKTNLKRRLFGGAVDSAPFSAAFSLSFLAARAARFVKYFVLGRHFLRLAWVLYLSEPSLPCSAL
jgi:hypothetical protein